MATFHGSRAASRLYASFLASSSGLSSVPSNINTRTFSQTYTLAKASTSKRPFTKPILRKETPEEYLSNSATSEVITSRQKALNRRISSRKLVSSLETPVSKAAPEESQYPPRAESRPAPTPAQYKLHKERMKKKFPEGWAPPRTISREAMEILRALHAEDPVRYRTPVLASRFKISPEAVSRILKSKWKPSPERIARAIARDHVNKDKWIAEKLRMERAEVTKSLEGRLDIVEKAQGKDRLTMK
ncbi:hypothetical protein B0J17DRAFT_638064 [Rhizoctonia solani]|nr:hypothetical protein B0J17DRAFT_638064 [Rhizoctonia solani]